MAPNTNKIQSKGLTKKMKFQGLRNFFRPASATTSTTPQDPSLAVASGIFQINTAVGTFSRLVDALGSPKDTPELREKLHSTRLRISQLVKDTSAKFKAASESYDAANISARTNIEDAKLARDFQTTIREFQKALQRASERESAYIPSEPPHTAATTQPYAIENAYIYPHRAADDEELTQDFESQFLLLEQKRQELGLLYNEILDDEEPGMEEAREQIREVNNIFSDLAVLVGEQNASIGDPLVKTEASFGLKSRAKQHTLALKRASSTWHWMLLTIFLIAIIVVLLIIIIQMRSKI